MKYGLLMIMFVNLLSCSNVGDKSVIDDLSLEDIRKLTNKYPDFGPLYDEIVTYRRMMSDGKLVDYMDLTYNDCINFNNKLKEKNEEWNANAEIEWENTYGHQAKLISDELKEWENKKKEYFSTHNITIEPIAYEYTPLGSLNFNYPKVTIRIKSTRGNIESLHAVFAIENKDIDNFDNILHHHYSMGLGGFNDLKIESPTSETTIGPITFSHYGFDFKDEDFGEMTFEELNRKYKFDSRICYATLTPEAQAAENKAFPIPQIVEKALVNSVMVKNNLEYVDNIEVNDWFTKLSSQLYEKDFVGHNHFVCNYVKEQKKAINPKAYSFFFPYE